jgi:putative peptide zinc metalloprotease protein
MLGNPVASFDQGVPNLAPRSTKYWASLIKRRVFGVEKTSDLLRFGEHVWLLDFAPASYVYRMIVLFGISLSVATLYHVFGILLALWRLFSGIAMAAAKIVS